MNKFVFNETSYLGWGSREVLVEEINRRGYKKALLVTDNTLLKIGITSKITDLLNSNKMEYYVFSDVRPNPTISNVKKGLKMVNKYHFDYIIALGGGSVIDVAKAIGVIYNNPEYRDVKSLNGTFDSNKPSLPIIAIPTTYGSSSETTIYADIVDEAELTRIININSNLIPVVAIVDPELMNMLPVSIAGATGMDALTHAIESYISNKHNNLSDMYALKAMNIIYKNIDKAVNRDKKAIEEMAFAQYIAGMGFSNSGLGIVHSMSHQVSTLYGVPHGIVNALLLPYIVEWNGSICGDRFMDVASAFGITVEDKKDAIKKVNIALRNLRDRLGVPEHLSDIKVKEEDIPTLAEKALNDPCTKDNPKETTLEDFIELFKKAL